MTDKSLDSLVSTFNQQDKKSEVEISYSSAKKKLKEINISSPEMDYDDFKLRGYNISNSIIDAAKASDELARYVSGAVEDVIVMDTETLGNSNSVKPLITEIGYKRYKKVDDVFSEIESVNRAFGIGYDEVDFYEKLIAKAEINLADLRPDEVAVIERMSRASGDFNERFHQINGRWGIKSSASTGIHDLASVKEGFYNLKRLGKMTEATRARDMSELFNTINNVGNKQSGQIMGFNTEIFDITMMNRISNKLGIQPIDIEHHLDMRSVISMAFDGNYDRLHKGLIKGSEMKGRPLPANSLGRLETMSRSAGFFTDFHTAVEDSDVNFKTFNAPFEGSSLAHKISDIIETRFGTGNIYSNKSIGKVIHARKGLGLSKIDFVEQLIDGEYQLREYGQTGARRNRYYNGKIKQLDMATIRGNKELINNLKSSGYIKSNRAEPLYILQLEDFTDTLNKERITFIRETKEELQKMVQNNLEVLEIVKQQRHIESGKTVTRTKIIADTASQIADNSRRAYQSMFEATSYYGYEYAKKMYDTYLSVSQLSGDTPFTKSEINDMFYRNNIIRDGIGKNDILNAMSPLRTKTGKLTNERIEKFVTSYGVLSDTSITMRKIIKGIDASGIKSNQAKTIALNKSMQEVLKEIKNNKQFISDSQEAFKIANSGLYENFEELKEFQEYINEQLSGLQSVGNPFGGDVLQFKGHLTDEIFNIQLSGNDKDIINSISKQLQKSIPNFYQLEPHARASELSFAVRSLSNQLRDRGILASNYEIDPSSDSYTNARRLFQKISNSELAKEQYILEPLKAFNINERKMFGETMDAIVGGYGIDAFKLGKLSAESMNNVIAQYDNKTLGYRNIKEELQTILEKNYGYSESDVTAIANVLYGKNRGYVSNHGLSAVLFDNNGNLAIAYSEPKYTTHVIEDIALGRKLRHGSVVDQVKINILEHKKNKSMDIKTIQRGNSDKFNSKYMNVWLSEEGRISSEWWKGLRVRGKETSSLAIEGQQIVNDQASRLIKEGQYERAERIMNNVVNRATKNQSSVTHIMHADEMYMNVSDIINATSKIDYNELANFIPALYSSDIEVKNYMDATFGEDKMQRMFNHATGSKVKKLRKGEKLQLNEFGQKVHEWFISNIFENQLDTKNQIPLIKRIAQIADQTGDQYTIDAINDLIDDRINQFNKDKLVAQGVAWRENPIEYIPGGVYNSIGRPLSRQTMSFHNITAANIDKAVLRKNNIRLGMSVVTQKFKDNYIDRYKGEVRGAVMGNYRVMGTKEMTDRITDMFGEITEIYDTQNINKYITPEIRAWSKQNNFNAEEVYKGVRQMHAISDTWQQHGYMNPVVKREIWKSPEMTSLRYGKDIDLNFDDIDFDRTYQRGDIVGGNENVVYTGLSEAKILKDHSREGVLKFEPIEGNINERKLIAQGNEKMVMSTIDTGNPRLDDAIHNSIWGKETMGIVNLEITKHEGLGTVYMSDINFINDIAEELDKGKTKSAKVSMYNRNLVQNKLKEHLEYLNAEYQFVDDLSKGEMILNISGNPNDTGRKFSEDVMKVKEFFLNEWFDEKGNIKVNLEGYNTESKRIITDLLKGLRDEDTFRWFTTMGQMSEQYSSLKGLDDIYGKGAKLDKRMEQVIGTIGSLQNGSVEKFWNIANGKAEKKYQKIIDPLWSEVRKTDDYQKGVRNVKSLAGAIRGMAGENVFGEVKEIDISELRLKAKGAFTTDDLVNTIYKIDKADIVKVNLTDGLKIKNPLTGQLTNSVFVPVIKSKYIGGINVLTESEKKTAKFVDKLIQFYNNSMEVPVGMTTRQILDKSYQEMFDRLVFDISDHKKSIMSASVASGRLSYSGQVLSSTIISPIEDNNGFINKVLGTDAITRNSQNEIIKAYDISYESRKGLEAKGVDFKKIGQQLLDDDFIGDTEFKKIASHITDAEELGLEYVKRRGIMTLDTRPPSFRNRSTVLSITRLSDDIKGHTTVTVAYTAKGQVLDSDGDIKSKILLVDRENDGKLYRYDSENAKNMREILDAQSEENVKILKNVHEDYSELLNSRGHTYDGLAQVLEADVNRTFDGIYYENQLRNPIKRKISIKGMSTKEAIGYVSNENLKLRDVAEWYFTQNNATKESVSKYTELIELFTNETEQKLIDTKYLKEGKGYSKAEDYSEAMKQIFSTDIENRERGIKNMRNALEEANILKLEEGIENQWERVENILRELGSDTNVRDKYNDPMRKSFLSYKREEILSTAKQRAGLAKMPNSTKLQQHIASNLENINTIDSLSANNGDILHFEKNTKNVPSGVYTMTKSKKVDNRYFVEFDEVDGGTKFRHYENSITNMEGFLNQFSNILKEDDKIELAQKTVYNNAYNDTITKGLSSIKEYNEIINQTQITPMSSKQFQSYQDAKNVLKKEGEDAVKFIRKVEYLSENNNISSSTKTDLLSSMNNYIKEKGFSKVNTYGDELLEDAVKMSMNNGAAGQPYSIPMGKSAKHYVQNVLSDIGEQTHVYSNSKISSAPFINEAKQIRLIDLSNAKQQLTKIAKESFEKTSDYTIKAFGGDAIVKSKITEGLITKPMAILAEEQKSALNNLYTAMNQIINIGDKASMEYLEWNDMNKTIRLGQQGEVDVLGKQRITYGDNISMRMSDVSMDEIKALNSIDISNLPELDKQNIGKLQSRINSYMHAVDVAKRTGKETGESIVDAINVVDFMNSKGYKLETNVDNILKNTSKAVNNMSSLEQTATMAKRTLSENYDDVLSKLKGGGTGMKIAKAVGAMAVAGAIYKQHTALPASLVPERKPSGKGAPDSNGIYEGEDGVKIHYKNKPHQTIYQEEKDNGMKIKIFGKSDGSVAEDDVTSVVARELGGQMNVNINDNRSSINGEWLSSKIVELFE